MCGVLGIKGSTTLGQARILLQMLTHRGQDASGLAWNHNSKNKIKVTKVDGYPDLLNIDESEQVNQVIGSTRYPTYGTRTDSSNIDLYAQPFVKKTKYGILGIVHNGNIANISQLSDKRYECDANFIVDYLGKQIDSSEGNLSQAVKTFMELVDGSYSIIGILNDQIFTFRDPRGIRPLVIGRNAKLTIAASESVVLQNMGIMHFRDVNPGELILFTKHEEKEQKLIRDHAHCMFEYVYFANPTSIIEGRLVYQARIVLGKILGERIKEDNLDLDYLVPVPDTSRPACQGLSEVLNIPVREAIIKNRYLQRTFIMKSDKERSKAAKRKYLYIPSFIKDKNILVIDDSIVRGVTSKKIVADLRAMGAKKIFFGVTCPAVRYPCYYGIDITSDKELIGSGNTLEEIKKILNVDNIYYQKIEDLKKAIKNTDLCTACLSGSYPTPYAEEIRIKYLNGELKSRSHYEGA